MKILIIRLSAIGDVIHTLPALFLIKKQIPHAHVTWVVQQKAASLIQDQPFIDQVHVIPDKFLALQHLPTTWRLIKKLREHTWDAIIDFQGIHKATALLFFLRGKKYGFSATHARASMTSWFTHHHIEPEYTNIIQKNLALASEVILDQTKITACPAISTLQQSLFLHYPDKSKIAVDLFCSQHHLKKIIALCPNTTWPSKHWPPERWANLAQKLTQTLSPEYSIVLVGTAFGPAAKQLATSLDTMNVQLPFVPAWDLITTAYFFSKASMVIAPDTGLLHLADYLGIPAVGIFGPTSKKLHGPFLTNLSVTHTIQVECSHTYKKNHGKNQKTVDADNCMYKLSSEQVFNAILGMTKKLQK